MLPNEHRSGQIAEIPDILVDDFTGLALAHFLTHAHSDHMCGLAGLRSGTIYATETTRRLVLCSGNRDGAGKPGDTYEHLKTQRSWNILELNKPYIVKEYQPDDAKEKLWVTALDANHCPGSCMFLFQKGKVAVLHTGDVRAEPHFIYSLKRSPLLLPFKTGVQRLDAIYADMWFGQRTDDKYLELQDNLQSLEDLLKLLDRYKDGTVFVSNIQTIGFERAVCEISYHLQATRGNGRVHLSPYFSNMYRYTAECDYWSRRISAILTDDPYDAAIHFCRKADNCPAFVPNVTPYIKPVVNLSKNVVDYYNSYVKIKPEDEQLDDDDEEEEEDQARSEEDRYIKDIYPNSPQVYLTNDGRRFIHGKDPDDLVPIVPRFHFSRHSSYTEIRNLVYIFKPRTVYPLYQNRRAFWQYGFVMKRLFGDICTGSHFLYDEQMKPKYPKFYEYWITQQVMTTWNPTLSPGRFAALLYGMGAWANQVDNEQDAHHSSSSNSSLNDGSQERKAEHTQAFKVTPELPGGRPPPPSSSNNNDDRVESRRILQTVNFPSTPHPHAQWGAQSKKHLSDVSANVSLYPGKRSRSSLCDTQNDSSSNGSMVEITKIRVIDK